MALYTMKFAQQVMHASFSYDGQLRLAVHLADGIVDVFQIEIDGTKAKIPLKETSVRWVD
jgi:hypothetical protein